jgi:hypothetical protein
MDLAEFVIDSGIIKDTLGGRSFARIDMRHDPDVAGFFEWNGPCHFSLPGKKGGG